MRVAGDRRAPVGLIPAAGAATRLQPLDRSKETISVGGRPVLEYLVDRLRVAGCVEIRLTTTSAKHDVVDLARRLGLQVVLGAPETAADSLALAAAGLEPTQPVLFGFPDTIWQPEDGFVRLLAALDERYEAVLGLFRTPELTRSDVVVAEQHGLITEIQVKPAVPRSDLIWGCAAARAGIVQQFKSVPEPGLVLDRIARAGQVSSVFLSDSWIDIGTPEALSRVLAKDA
jgi:NDP-sugar pyrophosphorylase family protein